MEVSFPRPAVNQTPCEEIKIFSEQRQKSHFERGKKMSGAWPETGLSVWQGRPELWCCAV